MGVTGLVRHAPVVALFAALIAPAGAAAQSVKSTEVAGNGVHLTVYRDEFAGRTEYDSPNVKVGDEGGFAFASRIDANGERGETVIAGVMYYRGDWRRYDRAIFRGGETAVAVFGDRDVVSCYGSRYGGCTLSEGFEIRPTSDQYDAASSSGQLEIQLSAGGVYPVLIVIPYAHIEAVKNAQ